MELQEFSPRDLGAFHQRPQRTLGSPGAGHTHHPRHRTTPGLRSQVGEASSKLTNALLAEDDSDLAGSAVVLKMVDAV